MRFFKYAERIIHNGNLFSLIFFFVFLERKKIQSNHPWFYLTTKRSRKILKCLASTENSMLFVKYLKKICSSILTGFFSILNYSSRPPIVLNEIPNLRPVAILTSRNLILRDGFIIIWNSLLFFLWIYIFGLFPSNQTRILHFYNHTIIWKHSNTI